MFETIDARIMKYVPKSKQSTISQCWHDDDGYWIILKHGYHASNTDRGCHVIHEDTIAQLRYQISGIEVDPDAE